MQNCKDCQGYSNKNDKIGHYHCPIHRQCSGKTQWEPDICQHCIAFRDNLPTLSPKLHKQALKHLSEMLYRMRICIGQHQNIGNEWHFQGQRSAFLGVFSKPSQGATPINTAPGRPAREQVQDYQQDAIHEQGDYVSINYLAQALRPMFQDLSMQIAQSSRPGNATPGTSRSCTPAPLLPAQQSTARRPFFREFGHMWFYLTDEHKVEGNKLWLDNELLPF